MITIRIADFSVTPGGRFYKDGPNSGQAFRDQHLIPAFERSNEEVTVVLDDVAGLPPSFLEEAFGGLVRAMRLAPEAVLKRLKFIANETDLQGRVALIKKFISEAKPEFA